VSTTVADPAFISYCPAFDVPWLSNVSCVRDLVLGTRCRRALARIAPDGRTMTSDSCSRKMTQSQRASGWPPAFVDYVYASYSNATAFSPSHMRPLSATAKLLMAVQSLTAW